MGSVKRQTRGDYRGLAEWIYVSLRAPRTISKLIRNRSKLDQSFIPKMFEQGLASNGVFEFSEPVLVTYMDLDRLIA